MASPELSGALKQIANDPDKAKAYESLLTTIQTQTAANSPSSKEDLISIIDRIFDELGIVAVRNALAQLVSILQATKVNDTQIAVGNYLLTKLSLQATSFEEQNLQIRDLVATAHEAEEDFLEAANVLAAAPLDSSQRKISPEEKGQFYIRTVRNFLEVDDTTSAETYLNKFKNFAHLIDNPELMVHFQLSQARIQDARRDFLAAARGYQDISLNATIAEEERLQCLSMAIKCAVLAPAGPLRSRALKRLYTDERAFSVEEFGILEKTFLSQLIAPSEVEKFSKGLMPHQLAKTSDGSTVLVKAMGEHNLLGASRLYCNIGFDELGELLGVSGDRAESMTAAMIESGRLMGRIDQIDRYIFFEGGEATGEKHSGKIEAVVGRELRRWDANVQGLAEEVETVTTQLQMAHPEFVARHLVV